MYGFTIYSWAAGNKNNVFINNNVHMKDDGDAVGQQVNTLPSLQGLCVFLAFFWLVCVNVAVITLCNYLGDRSKVLMQHE